MSDDPTVNDLQQAGRLVALALRAAHGALAKAHGCDGQCVYLHALRQWERVDGDPGAGAEGLG